MPTGAVEQDIGLRNERTQQPNRVKTSAHSLQTRYDHGEQRFCAPSKPAPDGVKPPFLRALKRLENAHGKSRRAHTGERPRTNR
jgi:hypothetical protein